MRAGKRRNTLSTFIVFPANPQKDAMKRTRLTAAMLAATMSISTVHVAVPEATAQTVQTRTVSEVDQDAYDQAVEEWQHNRDTAEAELQEAHDVVASAEQRVTDAGEALGQARGFVDKARAAVADAEAALAAVDVEARQQEADDAAAELQSAEDRLAAAQQRVDDVRTTRDNAQAELEKVAVELEKRTTQLAQAFEGLEEAVAYGEEVTAEREKFDQRVRTGSDYSVEDWERLTGQAVAEIINDYRAAHGLHPLVTHGVYIEQARSWSRQMIADVPRLGTWVNAPEEAETAFRHSNRVQFGRSGENIAGNFLQASTGSATREQWKELPENLFTQWHESPLHNSAMLDPSYQGVGLGVIVEPDGTVWATTMFFRDDIPTTSGGRLLGDRSTDRAKDSGKSFYVPSGARTTMQTPPLRDNLHNTYRARPDYQDLVRNALDISAGKAHGVDPRVKQVNYDADRKEIEEAEELAAGLLVLFITAVEEGKKLVDELKDRGEAAQLDLNQSQDALDRATTSRNATRDDRDAAASAKNAADEALRVAQDTPKQPLIDDLATANDTLTSSEQAVADNEAALEDAREGLAEADRAVVDKQKALERIDAAKPVEDDFVVELEVVETLAPAPARVSAEATASVPVAQDSVAADAGTKSEGSSTGAVIGVILAILAVVGIAAVAVPKLMEQR